MLLELDDAAAVGGPPRSVHWDTPGNPHDLDALRIVRAVDDGWGLALWRWCLCQDERGTDMTSMTSSELVPVDEMFTHGERMALLGFLAAYRGATREAHASDLRQFSNWCAQHHLRLFGTHRVDIECFARDLEARASARATVARRLCTVTGFYRYAEEEGLIGRSPAVHVRRPRLDYESHAVGLGP